MAPIGYSEPGGKLIHEKSENLVCAGIEGILCQSSYCIDSPRAPYTYRHARWCAV
jgi:hypothetical protein